MEQLVLLVIIGLISLINWVMQKAAEKREQAKLERAGRREAEQSVYRKRREAPAPSSRPAAPTQDPFKELMDALGLPADAEMPPPVARRAAPEPEEEFVSLEEEPPPLPARPAPAAERPRWQPPRVLRPDEKTAQLASAFAAKEKDSPGGVQPSSVRALLADRSSKRHAVVLAEILGQPRALRPFAAAQF